MTCLHLAHVTTVAAWHGVAPAAHTAAVFAISSRQARLKASSAARLATRRQSRREGSSARACIRSGGGRALCMPDEARTGVRAMHICGVRVHTANARVFPKLGCAALCMPDVRCVYAACECTRRTRACFGSSGAQRCACPAARTHASDTRFSSCTHILLLCV